MDTRSIRTRVANACDLCKLRKIKCSGAQPCAYCVRRRLPDGCRYTVPRRRPRPRSDDIASQDQVRDHPSPSGIAHSVSSRHSRHNRNLDLGLRSSSHSHHSTPTPTPSHTAPLVSAVSPRVSLAPVGPALHSGPEEPLPQDTVFAALEEHEETEVPREARLLCDAQGKLIFIGDCAPLSFFQTVRRLVTTRVDAHAFAPETSGYSALENVYSRPGTSGSYGVEPPPIKSPTGPTVSAYLDVTAGLIDLFDNTRLADDIAAWAEHTRSRDSAVDVPSAVNYLVLAIGCQKSDEHTAQLYFDYARNVAFASLSANVGVASVQVFILITIYSLGACQLNGAFLFFGIAARAAYSIGIHRTAVNARFGPEVHRQRDCLWKSLRVVDLFLSTSMGRPPATSDVDCTVPCRAQDDAGHEKFDLLNASAQIFLVIEAIVVEVYSRRKISPRLTEGISRELRDWSTRWLHRLKEVVDGTSPEDQPGMANGACQILSSYYYAVILVSRPFLMVELHRRLSEGSALAGAGLTGKSKLADACIDAAILMVEPVQNLIERGSMTRRAPVIISWLFASSLVLGISLLGGFGRILKKHCRACIAALEYFAQTDAHALQYSLIAKSLLATALQYLERKEVREREVRRESSVVLFGLLPRVGNGNDRGGGRAGGEGGGWQGGDGGSGSALKGGGGRVDGKGRDGEGGGGEAEEGGEPRFNFDFFLGLNSNNDDNHGTGALERTPDFSLMGGALGAEDAEAEQTFGALNLFPLLETDGHIDLANYF